MTKEKAALIKWSIIAIILGIGYFFKGIPMVAALAVGIFTIIKLLKKRTEPEEDYEDEE